MKEFDLNRDWKVVLAIAVVVFFVLSSVRSFDGLFSLSRTKDFNKFTFDFSDSVIPGGRGIIPDGIGIDGTRKGFVEPKSKPGVLIGKDSFSLKLVDWPLESAACLQSFLKDAASHQQNWEVSGFSDWQVPSSCLVPAVIEFNEYSASGLGPKVKKSLKLGESVKINPCMDVKYVSASLNREFRTPDNDPDTIKVVFELSVSNYSCLSVSGLSSSSVFKLGSNGSRQIDVVNKLYPRLESFVDYRSINKGLEAEQTTQIYNNPYVLLDKMGSNVFGIPLDNALLGDREDQLYYGFYLRSEDGSVIAVYEDERLDSTYIVNEKGVASAKVVSVPVSPSFIPSSEPSVMPVKKGVSTGFILGTTGFILLVVGLIFLFFTKIGKGLINKLRGRK